MQYLNIVILAAGLTLWLESFPDTSKVIQLFQIQVQSKNYIVKYNANTETESCLNWISATVITLSPCGDVIVPYITLNS